MSEIQPLTPADIPAVAQLFMRVFRKSSLPAAESLKSYLTDLYLNNPWADPSYPSFVSRRSDGRITGFIGSLPRRMILEGLQISVVVAGNHMVDQEDRELFTGSNLLKRLFGGPQDLTLTDSANEISRRLWERLGGVTLLNYSLRWIRILRPAAFALDLLPFGRESASWGRLRAAAGWPGDIVARRFLRPPAREPIAGLTGAGVSASLMQAALPALTAGRRLVPLYTVDDLSWLISMAGRKEQFGDLRSCAVYDGDALLGWYFYYARRSGLAHVLQVASLPAAAGRVLHHLVVRAFDEGLNGVTGIVDPSLLREYHQHTSFILLRDMYAVAYARSAGPVAPLLGGSAFLSRLEGEWWTRLQGDRFT